MCGVLGKLDIIDNDINYLRLSQIDPAIAFLLDVDAKEILDVFLVLDALPCSLNLVY